MPSLEPAGDAKRNQITRQIAWVVSAEFGLVFLKRPPGGIKDVGGFRPMETFQCDRCPS